MPNLEPPHADTVLENRRSHRHSVTCSSDVSISDDSSDDQSWNRDDSTALSEEVDLESGDLEVKVHLGKLGRDCRICHLGLEGNGGGEDLGVLMELGCSCKGDLGAAHKQCAETWFKIKGNTACEICGATALNVAREQTNETNTVTSIAPTAPMIRAESQTFWHSRRVMNFLLACMVFAFVISWLFHFKVLS